MYKLSLSTIVQNAVGRGYNIAIINIEPTLIANTNSRRLWITKTNFFLWYIVRHCDFASFIEAFVCMLPTTYRFNRARNFRGEDKKKWPIRQKNFLCRACLLTNWDKVSNLYRWSSIHAAYQISFHLGEALEEKICFSEIDQLETRSACGCHVCKPIRMKWAIF